MNIKDLINECFDFAKCFDKLISEYLEDLEDRQYEAEHFQAIINFVKHERNEFTIELDECWINDRTIAFSFGKNFNDANESNTQCTTAEYYIVFGIEEDEFTACEYEQG